MNIEIGKTYQVSNKYKKRYVEYEYLKNYDTGDIEIGRASCRERV